MKTALRRAAIFVLIGLYAVCLLADVLAPASYATQFREHPGAPPSRVFPLGTDELGRDLLSRLLYGSRLSLLLAPAAALISTALAAAIGAAAGYAGGAVGSGIMRLADLFMSLPWLFLLLAVRAFLPLNTQPADSVLITFLLLGLLGWAAPARVVAAAAGSLRGSEFALHARASGAGKARLLFFQVLPNLKPVLVAQFWIAVPVFILSEANLGLLGLGVGEPLPSWGNLLRSLESFHSLEANPWLAAPAALLLIVVACFHLVVPMEDYSK
jgi:peptide/nickel transport system permease protein